jgi:hypothetical protein
MNKLEERSEELKQELAGFEGQYLNWLFSDRFYPIGLLPGCFNVKNLNLTTGKLLSGKENWRMPLKIAPPDDRLTSKYFGVYHPDALHDFLVETQKLKLTEKLRQSDLITSYSLPLPPRTSQDEKVRGVSDYLRLEDDISSDSWAFEALVKLDVKHCYPSIYSHSIHWAIDGYENVRLEDPKTLQASVQWGGDGQKIDAYIQALHGGFTKGLTVGPGASDFIVELLFRRIDHEISDGFKFAKVSAKGGRYKDDYRILVKKKSQVGKAIEIVENILRKYLLNINEDKTVVGSPFDVLQRKWMVEYNAALTDVAKSQKQFLWYLSHVAELQKQYPGKRLLPKFLSSSAYIPTTKEEFRQIISVLLSLADDFKSTVPFVVSYIEKIALKFNDTSIPTEFIGAKIFNEKNSYNAIWYLYYLMNYGDLTQYDISMMKFQVDPFCNSIIHKNDLLFASIVSKASFFNPVDGPIYKQTEMFTELY